jgi:homoserine O-acetyltransferase
VAVLGGISAGRSVVADGQGQAGWWSEVVGPAKALDTTRWRVLGIDYLGGSGATTGPRAEQSDFPSISAYDQAEILRRVVEQLGIGPLQAIVGASYGGMVALAFAERHVALTKQIVVISAAHYAHPMATAWRSMQRAFVRYATKHGEGWEGLKLARALAMATYRSPAEFAQRFTRPPIKTETGYRFSVEDYLLARGSSYSQSYLPAAFVCLSESIDLHRVDPAKIAVPVTLIGIAEDQLVPLADMRSLKDGLAGPVRLFELASLYGHDAFLKESAALKKIFAEVLLPG